MNALSPETSRSNASDFESLTLDQKIAVERLTDAQKDVPVHIIGFAIISLTFFLSSIEAVNLLGYLFWGFGNIIAALLGFAFCRIDHFVADSKRKLKKRFGEALILFLGVFWCLFPFFLLNIENLTLNMIASSAMAVICINGAPTMLLVSYPMYVIYALLVIAGMIFIAALNEMMEMWLVVLFSAVYLVLLVSQGWKLQELLLKSIRIRLESQENHKIAEQAVVDKSHFFSAASHDIRQPLQAIIYLVELLKREVPEKLHPTVSQIDASVDSMSQLLTGLLNVSKLDAGAVSFSPQTLNVAPVIQRIISEYEPAALKKGLRIESNVNAYEIYSDPILLGRVLSNLTNNAIKYTQKGVVSVATRITEQNFLEISITDTGSGIPESEQDNIFKEFYQLDNSERDQAKGLGLGLAIVKRLVSILGIALSFKSSDTGSQFSLCLAYKEYIEVPVEPVQQVRRPVIDFTGINVFYVEDNKSTREAFTLALEDMGCQLTVASSYDEVKSSLQNNCSQPSIIITDYRLPDGRNGAEVILLIKRHFQHAIPSIVVTGDSSVDFIKNAQGNSDILLHKPVTFMVIKLAIQKLCGLQQNVR